MTELLLLTSFSKLMSEKPFQTKVEFEASRLAEVLSEAELKQSLLTCLKDPRLEGFLSISAGMAYWIKKEENEKRASLGT